MSYAPYILTTITALCVVIAQYGILKLHETYLERKTRAYINALKRKIQRAEAHAYALQEVNDTLRKRIHGDSSWLLDPSVPPEDRFYKSLTPSANKPSGNNP